MFSFFKQQKWDVICLQESHITKRDVEMWEKQWGGQILYNAGTSQGQGEMILISKSFNGTVSFKESVDRILVATVQIEYKQYTVVNAYSPNDTKEKITFLLKLQTILKKYDDKNILLAGDFNMVMSNDLDIITGKPHNEKEVKQFRETMQNNGLVDIWRVLHEKDKEYTWSRHNPFIARRLDYCFMGENVVQDCLTCEIISTANTDHRAVVVSLNNSDFVRGPGCWRFNNSFLSDPIFVSHMNSLLNSFNVKDNSTQENAQMHWECCKLKIKDFCMDYGKNKATQKRNEILELTNKLQRLEKQFIENKNSKEIQSKIINTKHQLEVISIEKARGAQIRSRAQWIENGEKSTQYFFNLEKQRAKRNIITHIKDSNGDILTKQEDILKEQVRYYSDLYTQNTETQTTHEDTTTFMENVNIPKLTAEEKMTCEGLIEEEEAAYALHSMKNGSAPGSDGLTIEFMKFFWSRIKNMIINSFNSSYDRKEMSFTQKQGIVILIHKGNDLPRDELSNWRPITLTNADYKIVAKVLARRLNCVIDKLISEDQVGYLKGRSASSIIRTIDDTINYLNNTGKAGFLLAMDYSKAFDTISRKFMLESLQVFGFGPELIRWITTLMTNTESSINHGGWITERFKVNSGIRQGCPLSPLIFILAAELFALKVRSSDIVGIELPNPLREPYPVHLKCKQLADDTSLFLKDSNDITKAAQMINVFSKISGLKLNKQKTKILEIGKNPNQINPPFQIVQRIKILGVIFENGKHASDIEENWTGRIKTIKQLINVWSKRDLSIIGKILIVKTFLVSKLIYIMQSIGIPDKFLMEIQRLFYKFIWQRKCSNKKAFEKVKRVVMEGNIDTGGLKMVNLIDMQNMFYLQWIGKLSKTTNSWTVIPKWSFSLMANGMNAFCFNSRSAKTAGLNKLKNTFWKKAFCAYLDLRVLPLKSEIAPEMLRAQYLWNNSHILYKKRTLYFPSWIKKGIEFLHDISHENENRLLTYEELIRKVNTISIFDYNALVNAIPLSWVAMLNRNTMNIKVPIEETLEQLDKKPKMLLKAVGLLKKPAPLPCAVNFWNRKLQLNIEKKHWEIANKCTKEVRLRVLHWKIIQNIYPTNVLLKKMRVSNSEMCKFCPQEIDYIEHFFWECQVVKTLWKAIEQTIHFKIAIYIKLDLTDVLFGYTKNNLNAFEKQELNHIILVGKMCISKYKYGKQFNILCILERELDIRNLR